jgi:hypothetical protein
MMKSKKGGKKLFMQLFLVIALLMTYAIAADDSTFDDSAAQDSAN